MNVYRRQVKWRRGIANSYVASGFHHGNAWRDSLRRIRRGAHAPRRPPRRVARRGECRLGGRGGLSGGECCRAGGARCAANSRARPRRSLARRHAAPRIRWLSRRSSLTSMRKRPGPRPPGRRPAGHRPGGARGVSSPALQTSFGGPLDEGGKPSAALPPPNRANHGPKGGCEPARRRPSATTDPLFTALADGQGAGDPLTTRTRAVGGAAKKRPILGGEIRFPSIARCWTDTCPACRTLWFRLWRRRAQQRAGRDRRGTARMHIKRKDDVQPSPSCWNLPFRRRDRSSSATAGRTGTRPSRCARRCSRRGCPSFTTRRRSGSVTNG